MDKPEINYPCKWSYRLIGTEAKQILDAVEELISGKDFQIVPSNQSSNNRYISFNLAVIVDDDNERNDIFMKLKENPAILMVI